jgi:polyisoprenoid-binding protein YceI
MMRILVLAAVLAVATVAPASGARWSVNQARSHLGFVVQWSGQPFIATFKVWNATIDFDPADLAHAKVTATIDLGSETSAIPDDDDGLKGTEGFAVGQFPTAHFETISFTAKGANNYVARGQLSLHGVTRQIDLPFVLTFSGDTVHMTGKTTVLRTDYRLGQGEWASPATIAHEVTITVDLTATKVR